MRMLKITTDENDEAADIPSMRAMTSGEYESYLDHLFFLDHHDVLRTNIGQYPIASTPEQMDVLIKYIQAKADWIRNS